MRHVSMGEATAAAVRKAAEDSAVLLSAHAPYYINLNSKDPEKVRASLERLLKAARVAAWCGARSVVFHVAYYHNDSPTVVYKRVKARLETIAAQLRDEALDVCLRPETSGRPSQFGSLDEILQLSAEIDGVSPCIDFGHLHARSAGAVNSYAEFGIVLDRVGQTLGASALQDVHIHLQGIAYTDAGERKHLTLEASDARFEELLQALLDWGVGGRVICESPSLEEDALLLKRTYVRLASKFHQAGNGEPVA